MRNFARPSSEKNYEGACRWLRKNFSEVADRLDLCSEAVRLACLDVFASMAHDPNVRECDVERVIASEQQKLSDEDAITHGLPSYHPPSSVFSPFRSH